MNYSLVSLPLLSVSVFPTWVGRVSCFLLTPQQYSDISSFNANLSEEEVLEHSPTSYRKQNHFFCVITAQCPKGRHTSNLQLVLVTASTSQCPLPHKLLPVPLQQRAKERARNKDNDSRISLVLKLRTRLLH